jgi:hypothetical protein
MPSKIHNVVTNRTRASHVAVNTDCANTYLEQMKYVNVITVVSKLRDFFSSPYSKKPIMYKTSKLIRTNYFLWFLVSRSAT